MKINENEKKVLEVLSEEFSDEAKCFYFRSIVSKTGLELKQVRRACRSLARKGLAEYVRGLFDDEGMAAGSGYCATEDGAALISPCDVCGKLSIYDYVLNSDGKLAYDYEEENVTRILECSYHYKQSPKIPKLK